MTCGPGSVRVPMKRAVELFTFEGLPTRSPHISLAWQTHSDPEPDEAFMSVAVTHWEMVVTRQPAATWVTVRGPETKAQAAPIPADADFFGIQFSLGTYLPHVDMRKLVGGSSTLRPASPTSVWLDGSTWELPGPTTPTCSSTGWCGPGCSSTTLSCRRPSPVTSRGSPPGRLSGGWPGATGLTRGTIRQIRRAERAVELLGGGVAPLEVARRVGYTDQSHLTRSLTRFVGQTPAQIVGTPGA